MRRLEGLDLARYLALIGMVIVNFDVVMASPKLNSSAGLASLLQGRAAALFVVLAGIGFGLAANNKPWFDTFRITIKRVVFLLAAGMINASIFQADIIHYYAFYFLFAVFILPLSNRFLTFIIIGMMLTFVLMVVLLNYDQGWDWNNYHYLDFWTVEGFIRNLFFNGWHPVFPWLSFLLAGVALSRLSLQSSATQLKMVAIGLSVFLLTSWVSQQMMDYIVTTDAEAAILFGTEPIPPMPLYLLAAGSLAIATIGCCLLFEPWLRSTKLLGLFTPAGKQTLTWYIIHIILGMGALESMGRISNQTHEQALLASSLFCVLATVVAYLWNLKFKQGPMEALMRKLTG
ncbi:MAG: DUF418 domain-containing protein [Marinicella sp.]